MKTRDQIAFASVGIVCHFDHQNYPAQQSKNGICYQITFLSDELLSWFF